ncbi:MAG: DUF368 domain-containing protein [Kiritimatiellae bacterium]|nr:DUF368 domain-containing protein [Kiritimatiellia bacterium]
MPPLPLQLIHGFLVGLAGLLPGLCGSTLLVLFGIYRPLTAALAHPCSGFRQKWLRFGPFFLAAGAGLLVGSRVLAAVFARHETATLFLFMGFMLGALPDLFAQARQAKGNTGGWIAFVVLFLACLALDIGRDRLDPRAGGMQDRWEVWALAGAGIGLGSMIPGASVAFILIAFDLYQPLLDGVGRLDAGILVPVVIGAGIAIFAFARVADWLFRHAEGIAIRGVLGLAAGSLWLVYPGWPGAASGWRCLLLLGAGYVLSARLNRWGRPDRS